MKIRKISSIKIAAILFLLSIFWSAFAFLPYVAHAEENLDELVARKARYATNPWPTATLENSSNSYIWQPETVMYQDVTTGHEVWVLIHAPDRQEIYSKEHGSNVWSYDGSRIGFFSTSPRPTANAALGSNHWRWLVNSDGSNLRAAEGYGRQDVPFEGFGWAHTENAYYAFGSTASEAPGSTYYNLYKNAVGAGNRVSGSLVLSTASANTYKKDIVKEGVSSDDSWVVARDITTHTANTSCNFADTREMYFIRLGSSPQLTNHWGIARTGTPVAAAYAGQWHDIWSPGPNPTRIVGTYEGDPTSLFLSMVRDGSCADGGPTWQDWNGTSFGDNEDQVISAGSGATVNYYGNPYFGHPVFDRWGKYVLMGTYTDSPAPGTRIYNMQTNTMEAGYVFNYNKYDGSHKSWSGWTDYVISEEADWPPGNPTSHFLLANQWNQGYQNSFYVVNPHYSGTNSNYNALPRPGQSPDGTKVAFAQSFLNNNGQAYPYIAWAVVYYPKPPVNLSAQGSGGNAHIIWNRPSYTTRGWPNEATDPPPKAKEIKGYHVWQSDNGQSGWSEITIGASPTEYIDIQLSNGTVKYYAVTSEEHSRLESRQLSEIIRVSVDNNGTVTGSQAVAAGQTGFWTTTPPAPSNFTSTALPTPGQYRLTWTEPSDSKIRYYNIYYSNSGAPPTDVQHRIASVPAGTNNFIDWLADRSQTAYYRITAVDRQGNEGSGGGNVSPTVTLSANTISGNAPLAVNFTATASDTDGTIAQYEWDLDGNGVYEAANTSNTHSYTYNSAGSYSASVRVTDNGGATASSSVTITISSSSSGGGSGSGGDSGGGSGGGCGFVKDDNSNRGSKSQGVKVEDIGLTILVLLLLILVKQRKNHKYFVNLLNNSK